MRWNEIVEGETAERAAKSAAKERRRQAELSAGRRAKSDAARKYQSDLAKANDKLNNAASK